MAVRKRFFTERMVRHIRLSREVVRALSQPELKMHLDNALRHKV